MSFDEEEIDERILAEVEMLMAAFPDEVTLLDSEETKFLLHLGEHGNDRWNAQVTIQMSCNEANGLRLQVLSYRGSPQCPKHILEETVAKIKATIKEAELEEAFSPTINCCLAAHSKWTDLVEAESRKIVDQHDTQRKEKQERLTQQLLEEGEDVEWISSTEPLVDRKSVFQAHICHVTSEDKVRRALNKLLLSSSKLQKATHNMYAYRFTEVSQEGVAVLKHDNSDDGEDGAGSRLAQLLQMRKEDGVLVVVSRWFGGIQLGPKRFAHISNVARDHLDYCHSNNLIPNAK